MRPTRPPPLVVAQAQPGHPARAPSATGSPAATSSPAAPPAAAAPGRSDPYPNTTWLLLCAALVFSMQLGFALLEAGLVETKNAVSVLYKNTMDLCIGLLGFAVIGFPLMTGNTRALFDVFDPVFVPPDEVAHADPLAYFLFHAAFAATTATICSGALAGRIRLRPYMALSFLITSVIYPLVARVAWVDAHLPLLGGGGAFEVYDFAGGVVVHGVGGMAALGATLALGRRKNPNFTAHNVPLATAGMFILFLGWFGFNMGSVTAGEVSDPVFSSAVALVGTNTALAAASAGLASYLVGTLFMRLPQLSMNLNGVLAGLVIITPTAPLFPPLAALALGFGAGSLVAVYGGWQARRSATGSRIDDPVGAIPVHGFCGMLGGCLVVFGRFDLAADEGHALAADDVAAQLIFALLLPLVAAGLVWLLFKVAAQLGVRLRVKAEAEDRGLDLDEHGERAYELHLAPPSVHDFKAAIQHSLQALKSFDYVNAAAFLGRTASSRGEEVAGELRHQAPFRTDFAMWVTRAQREIDACVDFIGDAEFRGNNLRSLQADFDTALRELATYPVEPAGARRQAYFEEKKRALDQALTRMLETLDRYRRWIKQNEDLLGRLEALEGQHRSLQLRLEQPPRATSEGDDTGHLRSRLEEAERQNRESGARVAEFERRLRVLQGMVDDLQS